VATSRSPRRLRCPQYGLGLTSHSLARRYLIPRGHNTRCTAAGLILVMCGIRAALRGNGGFPSFVGRIHRLASRLQMHTAELSNGHWLSARVRATQDVGPAVSGCIIGSPPSIQNLHLVDSYDRATILSLTPGVPGVVPLERSYP